MSETLFRAGDWGMFAEGDRVVFHGGRHAVIKAMDGNSITIAYRDKWFWRLAWKIEDAWKWLRRVTVEVKP